MLMQDMTPEERKKYRQGDCILYDDRPTDEQQQKVLERAARWGETVNTCIVCGRIVEGRGKYCSQRCVNDAYMERRRQRHEAQLRKACAVCGKPFTAKRTDAVYCSPACKQAAYRRRVTASRLAQFAPTDNGNVTDNGLAKFCQTDNGNEVAATKGGEAS